VCAVDGRGDARADRFVDVRIAVLSDIHSNLVALDAVLAQIGSVDAVWHLGDVVGYGPEPDAVVERLAKLDATGVRGNHDAAAAGGEEIEWFNPEARTAMEWTRSVISDATREWLDALPPRRVENDFTMVHGSPRDPIWEYVTSAALARAGLSAIPTEHGLHGHTHVPIAFTEVDGRMRTLAPRAGNTVALGEGRTLLNPGSVGQPRDGDPRASYMVIDTDAATATWGRAPYDIDAVATMIEAAGLPIRLADRLRVGA
jgi:diadenosine tetraphosphatase ApaH/serine/threonine PP2A family protein phosphatase